MIFTQMGKIEIIPTILAQLEQWMKVSRDNFSHDELKSLEDLNAHILRSIAESDYVVVKDENGVTDLDEFMTTYNKESSQDNPVDNDDNKEENASHEERQEHLKQDANEVSMRAVVNDFLSRVSFGGAN